MWRILNTILIFLIFIIIYLKYYEKRGIYFPIKEIAFTPKDSGLNYEDIYFTTSDNLKLNGWFIPAQNPCATLLYLHGNAGNISHRLELIQVFNQLNLNVFIIDYRGYGRSEGVPSEEGLYLDAEASYEYLVKTKNLPENKIIIFGKSIGANVAVDLAKKKKPLCLIIYGGFTSAYEMGKVIFPFLDIFRWLITIKFDAENKIKEIKIPKLIIHSIDDEIVPFRLGKKLFESANEPKDFLSLRGGHNEAILSNKEEFIERIRSFLGKILSCT
ncbi:MAG: alpha/beta hydrolase [Candidatus Omnitrophica bacterium]|nr:alpha/beta hydrolase [Candidatus Omnitrophota bacterium]